MNSKMHFFPVLFQKKEWLCLTCQTQRAMSGALGEPPTPGPQPMGSPAHAASPNQLQAGTKPSGPQQHKPPGAQVSGKQGGPQSKAPGQKPPPQSSKPGQPSPKPAPGQPSPKPAPGQPSPKPVHGQPSPKAHPDTRKQQPQQPASVKPKVEKEIVKASPKKGAPEVTSVVKEQKKANDMQKSKHHDVSDFLCPPGCMVCMVVLVTSSIHPVTASTFCVIFWIL